MDRDFSNKMLKNMPLGYALHCFVVDDKGTPCDYVFLDINSTFETYTGLSALNIIGKTVTEVLPDIKKDEFDWIKAYATVAYGGEKLEIEQYSYPLKKWYTVIAYSPEEGYFITLIKDKTEEKKLQKQMIEIEKLIKRQEILIDIQYKKYTDQQEFFDYTLHRALELTDSQYGYIYLYDEEKQEFRLNTWTEGVMSECKVIEKQTIYQLEKTGVWGEVVRQRKPIIVNDFRIPNPLKKGYPEGHVQLNNYMSIPIIIKEKIVAVAGLANKKSGYTEIDVNQSILLMQNAWLIHEQKSADNTIRQREAEFRNLAENAPDVIARFDQSLRHVYINRKFNDDLGLPVEHFLGKTNRELGMPEDVVEAWEGGLFAVEQGKLWESTLQEVFKEGLEKEMFFDYLTPAGRKYYHSRITPEFAPDGSVETVLSISRDITEIKELEVVLYQERLKTIQMHQQSLPDELPKVPGLALASYYRPASEPKGNYFNVIRHRDQLLLYLVDTKLSREDGIMQSLYVRKTIEKYLSNYDDNAFIVPADLLRYLTNHYKEGNIGERMSLCVLIAVLEISSFDKLRYVSTGFCTSPLCIISSSTSGGFSLENFSEDGEKLHSDFNEHSISVNPGSTFVFFTDGLINQALDSSSYELRLQEVLLQHAHLPPELINQAIETDFDHFNGDTPLHDDIAFIIAQLPEREERVSFKVESNFQQVQWANEKVSSLLIKHMEHEPDLFNFYELLVNAIEHGNKHDGGKKVTVEITITDRYYKITITDQGDGFNWRERINKELDWESESERGRGIIMTRMMTEYLSYNERGNKVTIITLN